MRSGKIEVRISFFDGSGIPGPPPVPVVLFAVETERGDAIATMPDGSTRVLEKGAFEWLT